MTDLHIRHAMKTKEWLDASSCTFFCNLGFQKTKIWGCVADRYRGGGVSCTHGFPIQFLGPVENGNTASKASFLNSAGGFGSHRSGWNSRGL